MTAAVALGLLPWLALALLVTFGIREPRPLPPAPPSASTARVAVPSVAIIVPARDEARSIERCLTTLAAQRYPRFSVIVVNDRSTDETADLARAVPRGNAKEVRVVEGEPLPPGWFGKPWACAQGARAADADLLLFTDADTSHHPSLLARSVRALTEDRAHALSLVGSQELGTFWERVVQPQIFALLILRYRRLDRPLEGADATDAIANGQYLLVRGEAYRSVGGHGAVRGEVVEDLRIAQLLVEGGFRLSLRGAMDSFSTRMYRSLGEIVEGWTKNVAVGARQSAQGWEAAALPAMLGYLLLFWLLPSGVLLGATARHLVAGSGAGPWTLWSGAATAVGLALWRSAYARFGVPGRYALLYPLGSALVAFIVLRSWVRGRRRIEWKGRTYAAGGRA